MDTTSHICMGVASGLVANQLIGVQSTALNSSVIVISVIAHTIPDIDVLFKLKSNRDYIQNHRGISHSFVFAFIWTGVVTVLGSLTGTHETWIYFLLAAFGVTSHILSDLLNGYGVQCLWPINKQWFALGVTYTFDALFLMSHLFAFTLIFTFKLNPLFIFAFLYSIFILYIIFAFIYQAKLKRMLINKYNKPKRLIVQSKSSPQRWKYVYETKDKHFYMGTIHGKTITELKHEKRMQSIPLEIEQQLKKDSKVRTFLEFTPIYNYQINYLDNDVMEIRYYDLRYLVKRKGELMYQFNCIVQVKDDKVLKSYLNFVVNEDTIYKKITSEKDNF